MIYTHDNHITSTKDVETFFHHIVNERKVNFHPDDMFEEYIDLKTKEPTFTPSECEPYNHLMEEAFEVCEKEGVDIFSIGLTEYQTALGIDVA